MTYVIAFNRRTLLGSIMRLWPSYRHAQDEAMRDAIKHLVENPREPCMVDGKLIQP
jgi:hypothetical protein